METIKIKGETVAVADLPAELQQQCFLYDHILTQLQKARLELSTLELARAQSSSQITSGYLHYKDSLKKDPDEESQDAD